MVLLFCFGRRVPLDAYLLAYPSINHIVIIGDGHRDRDRGEDRDGDRDGDGGRGGGRDGDGGRGGDRDTDRDGDGEKVERERDGERDGDVGMGATQPGAYDLCGRPGFVLVREFTMRSTLGPAPVCVYMRDPRVLDPRVLDPRVLERSAVSGERLSAKT